MDSPSFSSPSYWDYTILVLLRPLLAIFFVLSLILLGWFLAWKLVLVHVPLVQEICKSLRKKPPKAKPPTGRLSRFYSGEGSRNLASSCLSAKGYSIFVDVNIIFGGGPCSTAKRFKRISTCKEEDKISKASIFAS